MDAKYLHLTIQKITLGLLIAGSLLCLAMAVFDYNPLSAGPLMRTVLFIIGIAGILHMFRRDFYLPFLGETVMPCAGLEDRVPSGADTSVTVQVSPNAKLLYWAAEPAAEELKNIQDWKLAYAAFSNAGVTTADQSGSATLEVRKPQAYSVPFKGRLEPHIHYRICGEDGFLGRVNTVFIKALANTTDSIEGFTGNMEFVTKIDQNKFISELTKDPNRLSDIVKLLPGITNVMNELKTIVSRDAVQGGEQAHIPAAILNGPSIKEAFSNY